MYSLIISFYGSNTQDLPNFAYDNIIVVIWSNTKNLPRTLEIEVEPAVDWFKDNHVTSDLDKFYGKKEISVKKLKIYNKEIKESNFVKLFRVEIDY